MLELQIIISIVFAGYMSYRIVSHYMYLKKNGSFRLSAEYFADQTYSFVLLRWERTSNAADELEEYAVTRRDGFQLTYREIATSYKTELRDYNVSPGKTYTYIVYGGKNPIRGYFNKISNKVKITI